VKRIDGTDKPHKIVLLNPKGGCGKTTLATNLASFYAALDERPTLVDCDPQGYCLRWLEKRPENVPRIYGIDGCDPGADVDGPSRVPSDSNIVIVDLPAAIPYEDLHAYTYLADSILIPVMPSAIDVYAASRLIAELMLDMQLDRRDNKLAIVANRVRSRTRSYRMLQRFLASLKIPMLGAIRDSQNFVQAADAGIGICELPAYRAGSDLDALGQIIKWLDRPRQPVTVGTSPVLAGATSARHDVEADEGAVAIAD
jgi:chromosome partitioning protein